AVDELTTQGKKATEHIKAGIGTKSRRTMAIGLSGDAEVVIDKGDVLSREMSRGVLAKVQEKIDKLEANTTAAQNPTKERGDAAEQPAQAEGDQAPQGHRGLPQVQLQPHMDGARSAAGHSTRAAANGPAGRRPVRHLRPERPVPPRDQPQQPPEEAARARRARDHRAQREADAPGGG